MPKTRNSSVKETKKIKKSSFIWSIWLIWSLDTVSSHFSGHAWTPFKQARLQLKLIKNSISPVSITECLNRRRSKTRPQSGNETSCMSLCLNYMHWRLCCDQREKDAQLFRQKSNLPLIPTTVMLDSRA